MRRPDQGCCRYPVVTSARTRCAPSIRARVSVICLRRGRHRVRFAECRASADLPQEARRKSEAWMRRVDGSPRWSAKSNI